MATFRLGDTTVVDDAAVTTPEPEVNEPKSKKEKTPEQSIDDIEDQILGEFSSTKTRKPAKKVEPNTEETDSNTETEEPETKKSKSKKETKNEDDLDYKALYKFLADKGFISHKEDEEIPDDLDDKKIHRLVGKTKAGKVKTKLDNKYKASIEELVTGLDEKSNGLVKHILDGGNTEDYIKSGLTNTVLNLREDSITDGNAENILRGFYEKYTNLPPKMIEKEIQKKKDLEELVETAKEILPTYQDYEKQERFAAKQRVEDQKKQNERNQDILLKTMEQNIKATKEYLGVPITDTLRKKAVDSVTKGEILSKINKDLAIYLPRLAMLDQLGLLDGKVDKLQKIYGTKKVDELKESNSRLPFMGGKAVQHSSNSSANSNKSVINNIMKDMMGTNEF